MEMVLNNGFCEMSEGENMDTEAGGIGLIILVVGACALGLWNGFNDTMDQKQ